MRGRSSYSHLKSLSDGGPFPSPKFWRLFQPNFTRYSVQIMLSSLTLLVIQQGLSYGDKRCAKVKTAYVWMVGVIFLSFCLSVNRRKRHFAISKAPASTQTEREKKNSRTFKRRREEEKCTETWPEELFRKRSFFFVRKRGSFILLLSSWFPLSFSPHGE